MLIYLLVLTAGALIIASTLYWLARPTVYPNPGLSAYRPPTPDPIVARAAKPMPDTDQAAIQTAREENELLGWSPKAFRCLLRIHQLQIVALRLWRKRRKRTAPALLDEYRDDGKRANYGKRSEQGGERADPGLFKTAIEAFGSHTHRRALRRVGRT